MDAARHSADNTQEMPGLIGFLTIALSCTHVCIHVQWTRCRRLLLNHLALDQLGLIGITLSACNDCMQPCIAQLLDRAAKGTTSRTDRDG